jgi:hypothetical protein
MPGARGVTRAVGIALMGVLWIVGSAASAAPILSIVPPSQQGIYGSSVTVDLLVSGLGDGVAPSVGAFQTSISFNPLILGVNSVTFGDPVLGDQLDLFNLGSLFFYDETITGQVDLFEISFDSPTDLDSLQAPAFILARIVFDVIGVGRTALSLGNVILADSLGIAAIPVDLVDSEVNAVPEPAAIALVAFGFAAFYAYGRKRRTKAGLTQ